MPTRPPSPYNPDIMATPCRRPKCGAQPGSRCKGNAGYRITPPHQVRIEDSGWYWDWEHTLTLLPVPRVKAAA